MHVCLSVVCVCTCAFEELLDPEEGVVVRIEFQAVVVHLILVLGT